MTDPKIKAGMPYMDTKSAVKGMFEKAKQIGGTVTQEGDSIVLKNRQGKRIASVFSYNTRENTVYRYNDWEGREYSGENTNGRFTEIYSGDGIYVAKDQNGDGIVSENEIDLQS